MGAASSAFSEPIANPPIGRPPLRSRMVRDHAGKRTKLNWLLEAKIGRARNLALPKKAPNLMCCGSRSAGRCARRRLQSARSARCSPADGTTSRSTACCYSSCSGGRAPRCTRNPRLRAARERAPRGCRPGRDGGAASSGSLGGALRALRNLCSGVPDHSGLRHLTETHQSAHYQHYQQHPQLAECHFRNLLMSCFDKLPLLRCRRRDRADSGQRGLHPGFPPVSSRNLRLDVILDACRRNLGWLFA